MEHTDGRTGILDTTMSPDVGNIGRIRIDTLVGGKGSSRQLIAIHVEGVEGVGIVETEIQVEIDSRTGEFIEKSLSEWDRYDVDIDPE